MDVIGITGAKETTHQKTGNDYQRRTDVDLAGLVIGIGCGDTDRRQQQRQAGALGQLLAEAEDIDQRRHDDDTAADADQSGQHPGDYSQQNEPGYKHYLYYKTPFDSCGRIMQDMEDADQIREHPGKYRGWFEGPGSSDKILYLSYLAITRDHFASGGGVGHENAHEIVAAANLLASTLAEEVPGWREDMSDEDIARVEAMVQANQAQSESTHRQASE